MTSACCIGCGCDETHACVSDQHQGPCWWMRFRHGSATGVCSYCADLRPHWDSGGHRLLPKLISERFIRQPMALYQDRNAARTWMETPTPDLDGRSPREAILAGDLDRVREAIDRLHRRLYA